MKKNYIAPSTVAQTWASMGLMESITIGVATGSGGAKTFDQGEEIV